MTDLSATIAPKSDQLNADDLLAGPRTITITRVAASGAPDQPIAVYFEGDNGKPYKPCKSMRRVLVAMWGANGAEYVGRSLTLYADPRVKFGGIEVGGIRISAASHIERDLSIALTVTRAKKEPFTVRKLAAVKSTKPSLEELCARLQSATDLSAEWEAVKVDGAHLGKTEKQQLAALHKQLSAAPMREPGDED